MSEPFVGEIRMFAGNFAPRGWAFCDGQLLATLQNDALFSLFGTIYGGDGRTTFGLPEMRGRIPICAGSGPGLTPRQLGAKSGAEKETLTTQQLPIHSHTWKATTASASNRAPVGSPDAYAYAQPTNTDVYSDNISNETGFNGGMVGDTGGSRSHTNLQPYLCINFIVALFGIYPSRH